MYKSSQSNRRGGRSRRVCDSDLTFKWTETQPRITPTLTMKPRVQPSNRVGRGRYIRLATPPRVVPVEVPKEGAVFLYVLRKSVVLP